jgi:glycosyltransferase involved in cell wall biosynthesis
MSISILIPAFNVQNFIARSVRSALSQSKKADEIVIASDDGQDYIAVLASHGISDSIIRCVSTGGIATGLPHARNTALKASKGRVIVPLDADDTLAPAYIEENAALALEHGAVLSQITFIDDATGDEMSNCGKIYPKGLLALNDIYSASVHTYASIVYNREKIEFGWNEQVPLLEDAVFVAECAARLSRVYYNPQPLYRYYHREGSLCNSPQAPERFKHATQVIRRLIGQGEVCAENAQAKAILQAYLARNDAIETALENAISEGFAASYQDFIRKRPELLHTPLT